MFAITTELARFWRIPYRGLDKVDRGSWVVDFPYGPRNSPFWIAVHQDTLFTIVLSPALPADPERLWQLMRASVPWIRREVAPRFAANGNRRVRGSMLDMMHAIDGYLAREAEPIEVMARINQTPYSYLDMGTPKDAMQAFLSRPPMN